VLQPGCQIWYCFIKNVWLTAVAQKLDPGQQNIFGIKEVAAEERTEIYKLVTCEFHSAGCENIL